MAVRTGDQLTQSLAQKVDYFGGECSDLEDNIEDDDQFILHYSSEDDYDLTNNGSNDEDDLLETSEPTDTTCIKGRNGTKWCSKPEKTKKSNSKSLLIEPINSSSPTDIAMHVRNVLDAWKLFFTDEIINKIVTHTNEEIARTLEKVKEDAPKNSQQRKTDAVEMRAFIGLLYYAGTTKQNKEIVREMFSTEFGMNLFTTVMCRQRFEFISQVLRFDDKTTRGQRRETDVLAPIREIWDLFITQCRNNYNPSSSLTLDEQLLGFRGNFVARVYVKSKPGRYGLKVISLNDSISYYLYNAIPYCGIANIPDDENMPDYYVRTITEPIHHTNRKITLNNWFITLSLCDTMKNTYGLDMVGMIRKNQREIPYSFITPSSVGHCRYAYDHDKKITLLSFCPKRKKVILLASTCHRKGSTGLSGKPEMIEYHNFTKRCVNECEKMVASYSTNRKTGRWSTRLFFGMLDQAAINAAIIFNSITANDPLSRISFLKQLSMSLVRPEMERRLTVVRLNRPLRFSIMQILGVKSTYALNTDKLEKRKRCQDCPSKADKKTGFCCGHCGKPICDVHRVTVCQDCL